MPGTQNLPFEPWVHSSVAQSTFMVLCDHLHHHLKNVPSTQSEALSLWNTISPAPALALGSTIYSLSILGGIPLETPCMWNRARFVLLGLTHVTQFHVLKVHPPANRCRMPFLFKAASYSIVCNGPHTIYLSTIHGHLGCSYLLAIVDKI